MLKGVELEHQGLAYKNFRGRICRGLLKAARDA